MELSPVSADLNRGIWDDARSLMVGPFASHSLLDRIPFACGQDADLYSDYGVQRNLEVLRSSRPEANFSAAGRGLGLGQTAAKYEKTGASLVTSLIIMTCMAEGSKFELVYAVSVFSARKEGGEVKKAESENGP